MPESEDAGYDVTHCVELHYMITLTCFHVAAPLPHFIASICVLIMKL